MSPLDTVHQYVILEVDPVTCKTVVYYPLHDRPISFKLAAEHAQGMSANPDNCELYYMVLPAFTDGVPLLNTVINIYQCGVEVSDTIDHLQWVTPDRMPNLN